MSRFYFNTEEVITRKKKGYIEVEDNYVQVYDNVLDLTKKLSSLLDMQIFLYLAKISNKSNVFTSNEKLRNDLMKYLGRTFSKPTFNNCLERLCESRLIVKQSRGSYQLNPLTVWKESILDRNKMIDEIINGEQKHDYIVIEEATEDISYSLPSYEN